jgi:hypothetical protein
MTIEIGTQVTAWNPGTDRKATGTVVGMDGKYFKVEWSRTSHLLGTVETYIGTFVHAEVTA